MQYVTVGAVHAFVGRRRDKGGGRRGRPEGAGVVARAGVEGVTADGVRGLVGRD